MTLYCYDHVAGIPAEVVIADASRILPHDAVFLHKSGGVASFSDWFRYELQRRGCGTWVDTDVYLLRPLDEERPHLFGEQEPGVINNAILRVPEDSPMLPELLRPFSGAIPQWLPGRHRIASWIRKMVLGQSAVANLPWGSTGPAALTAAAKQSRLSMHALPPPVFYPVHWRDADWIADPSRPLESVVGDATVAVHLWNQCIKPFKDQPAVPGSFLARLHHEGRDEPIRGQVAE